MAREPKAAITRNGKKVGTVESLTIGGKPLVAIPADRADLPPGEVDHQAAMYAAHERGDTAEFERIRDGL